jgi:hypothetical protein
MNSVKQYRVQRPTKHVAVKLDSSRSRERTLKSPRLKVAESQSNTRTETPLTNMS